MHAMHSMQLLNNIVRRIPSQEYEGSSKWQRICKAGIAERVIPRANTSNKVVSARTCINPRLTLGEIQLYQGGTSVRAYETLSSPRWTWP